MKLGELIAGQALTAADGFTDVEVSGLSYDSRAVAPGHLFFATARDGPLRRRYLEEALSRGARAVVVQNRDDVGKARPAPTVLACAKPRLLMAAAASRFYDAPSSRLDLIGITGTSGKTTTAYLLASIFEAAGIPAGLMGTIGIFARGRRMGGGLTTPESIDIEAALAAMEREGIRSVAAEISSIGIAEERVAGLHFRACLFTNLGRDHLDYHGTLDDYFAQKLRLFTELLPASIRRDPMAVARGDDPWGVRVLQATPCRKLAFGLASGLDVYPLDAEIGSGGIRATIRTPSGTIAVRSQMIGEINLLNIVGASALAVALGIDGEAVAEGVRRCPGAPGRLEAVGALPGVTVLVDYAHKPDALEAVLHALGALRPRRLLCVFGCGGDRDAGKRPLMGRIAARLSNLPILTSDNPRSEEPLRIIDQVEAGLKEAGLQALTAAQAQAGVGGYLVEPDRRRAIALALEIARPGDLILIAGKGHEDYQLAGTRKLHFDDREVVREVAAEMAGRVSATM